MQAHAEHQQHDTNLGQLRRDVRVRHKTGCEGADDDPRQQITHQRRKPQAHGDKPQNQCKTQPHGDRADQ